MRRLVVEDDGPGGAVLPPNPLVGLDPDDPDPRVPLGLPLVAATARRFGGHVVVGERPGGGTHVRLWLPRVPADAACDGAEVCEADARPSLRSVGS